MASALDLSLDDVIGKATGGGKSSKGKGKRPKGERKEQQPSQKDLDGKLDSSLDDIMEARGNSKGPGKGRGKGKGKSWSQDDDGWGGSGWGGKAFGKNYGKGKGKNYSKGKSDYRPEWREREDFGGKGRKGKGSWSAHDERVSDLWDDRDEVQGSANRLTSRGSLTARVSERKLSQPVAKTATTSGGFLRVEQDDAIADKMAMRRKRELQGVMRSAANASQRAVLGSAGAKRQRAREEEDEDRRPRAKVAKRTTSATKIVKVTNIAKDLKARDVREAFEAETGKAASCELSKGTAYITFVRAGDAVKAVEAFHKGELNGKIISVVLHDA